MSEDANTRTRFMQSNSPSQSVARSTWTFSTRQHKMTEQTNASQETVTKVEHKEHHYSLKLPPFIEDDPHTWFSLIEAQFEIRGISNDSMRFYHAIAVLQGEQQKQIKDILKLPKDTPDKYEQIKFRLIGSYGLHDLDRAAKVLDWNNMAEDERPSVFIYNMLAMLGEIQANHPLFIMSVLNKLPLELAKMLRATSKCDNVVDLAKNADKIWQGSQHKRQNDLIVHELRYNSQEKEGVRARLGDRPHVNGVCPYHHTFGQQSHYCKQPCGFGKQSQGKTVKKIAAITNESSDTQEFSGNEMAGFQQ